MTRHQSMIHCQSIGIDVSKRTLAITGKNGAQYLYREIANTETSIRRWVRSLIGYEGLIIVESTAWYHYLIALYCSEAGLDIRVINPLLSSKYAKSAIRKVKSDPADSRHLANMGVTEPDLPAAAKVTRNRLQYQRMLGLLHGIDKQIQSFAQRLSDFADCMSALDADTSALESLRDVLRELARSKRNLQLEVDALAARIAEQESIQSQAVFAGLPGLRPISSLLSVTLNMDVKSAKSWIGFTGIDISVRQSGSWRGRSRLTKRGNRYLRKRLYQAAWGACLNYAEVRSYYDHLKAQGRCHVESVLMIARKLLRIAYRLLQTGDTYDPNEAFAY